MTNRNGAIAPRESAKTTAQMIAELNAELLARDPYENLRRQIRMATLAEFETRARAVAPAVAPAPLGPQLVRILAEMRAGR